MYFQVCAPSSRRILTAPSADGSKFRALTPALVPLPTLSFLHCMTQPHALQRMNFCDLSPQMYSSVAPGTRDELNVSVFVIGPKNAVAATNGTVAAGQAPGLARHMDFDGATVARSSEHLRWCPSRKLLILPSQQSPYSRLPRVMLDRKTCTNWTPHDSPDYSALPRLLHRGSRSRTVDCQNH